MSLSAADPAETDSLPMTDKRSSMQAEEGLEQQGYGATESGEVKHVEGNPFVKVLTFAQLELH